MKLTIAFLAALAAADAAEARSHRQARRQYGQPYEGGSYGAVSSSVAKPVETPAPSSVVEVPYVQSSAPAFEASYPPDAASSYPPSDSKSTPPAGGESYPSASVPVGGESSSIPYLPVETPYATPSPTPEVPSNAQSSSVNYGEGFPYASSSVVPSGVYPSSAASSGAYPSGGSGTYESSKPVEAASSVPYGTGVYPSSGPGYPTGTGVSPSSTPLSDYVTKTIYSTQIYSESSALVTKVVPVGTTCIPKDASKTPSPSSPVKVTSEYPVSEVVKTLTETLVYTVGVGSTAHPVTTEVVTTSTSTVYKTVVITKGKEDSKTAYPEGKPDEPTGTTTIKSTTTSTKYITVKPTPSGKVPSNGEGYPVGGSDKPSASKNAEVCAAPVTVTVTAKETVTVTKGQDKPTATPSKPEGEYPVPSGKPSKPAGGHDKPTKPSATPSGKYPIGNGTHPYPSGPTGFQTSTKPSYPVGTGSYGTDVPTKPSETSSLPYFSFVSEVPYATPSPSKTPSKEEVPYPSSSPVSPPAGGEYGPGYETPAKSSGKVPSNGKATPTPTPSYGSGYGTY